jgi:hypothetical protein
MNLIKNIFIKAIIFCIFLYSSAYAQQWGDFRYTESDDTITIIKYTGLGGVVELPSTIEGKPVARIGSDAFHYSSGLTGLTIPESVTSIGAGAFWGCSGLTIVTIPDSVTSIEAGAFAACTGLTSLTIPGSVLSIGSGAFCLCAGLTTIDVAPNNPNYSSQDGVLYNKDKTTLIQYPAGIHGGFSLPDRVTSIGDYAFRNCSGLTSVTIPSSVMKIGYGAFSYCTGLTSITIADSVTNIFGTVFYGCAGLTSAYFSGNAPEMGADVFTNCAHDFTVFYFAGSTGFTSPKWHGYSAAQSSKGACPAQNVLGVDHPYLQKLRAFRDGPLAQSEAGRKITQIYYSNGDRINDALDRSPVLRSISRSFFEAVARLVENNK